MKLIRMASAFFLILFAACASKTYKVVVPLGEERILTGPLPGIERLKIHRIKVEEPANLKTMVENRRNYRLDFFRQSKDPYFGTDRWSESCLRRNSTGALLQQDDGVRFRSYATADETLKTEVCLQKSVDVMQVIGECRRDGIFFNIAATGEKATQLKFRCPDELYY